MNGCAGRVEKKGGGKQPKPHASIWAGRGQRAWCGTLFSSAGDLHPALAWEEAWFVFLVTVFFC